MTRSPLRVTRASTIITVIRSYSELGGGDDIYVNTPPGVPWRPPVSYFRVYTNCPGNGGADSGASEGCQVFKWC